MPYPAKEQELLLTAALSDGQVAMEAWNEWRATWKVEEYLDQGSFRLLPLLYRNLNRVRAQDERMPMLKGIYKQTWYKNLKLFHNAREILLLLQEKDIPIILLKGTALSLQYYKDTGARPMSDLDIMIPPGRAGEAIALLHAHGWTAEFEEYLEYNLRYGRSMMFSNSQGFECDLHWFPFFESARTVGDEDFWNRAIPLDFNGIHVQTLCPADQLLHTIVHGVQWNPEPPIRWIADAVYILRSAEHPIDWKRFTRQVLDYKVVLQIRQALRYLRNVFNAPIPDKVFEELDNAKVSFAERLVHRYDVKNPRNIADTFFGKLHLLFIIYLRQSDKQCFIRQIFGFIRFIGFRTHGKKRMAIMRYYFSKKTNRSSQNGISFHT